MYGVWQTCWAGEWHEGKEILFGLLMLGVFTKHDYKIGEQLMTEKYQPASGTLFSDMVLT